MENLLRVHARLSWQLLCALDRRDCSQEAKNKDASDFSDPPASLPLDALEQFVRGLVSSDEGLRLQAFREAARLEPAWDRPPFELGQAYFTRRDCESALPWFSRVPPNRPDGPEAGFDTGVCHLLRNDAERAEAAFSSLADRARSADPGERLPDWPEVRNDLGVARLRLGRWNEAAAEFERAAALDPQEPNYWMNLGIARLAAQQPAAAVTALEHAKELDPEDKDARSLLIAALESAGRDSDAAAIRAENRDSGGNRAASQVPRDPVALARMARVATEFDRNPLHPAGDAPSSGSSKPGAPPKREAGGDRR